MDLENDPLSGITKEGLRDLLAKGWLTHDGMWFIHAAAEFGMEKANELNRVAIRGMSTIEVGRLVEALGIEIDEESTAEQVRTFLSDGLRVLMPSSISRRITISAPDAHTIHTEWDEGECFAYKGMRRAGLLEEYECGVLYRIECWLDALGIAHSLDPPTGRCRMAVDQHCSTDISLHSPGDASLRLGP